MASDQPTPPVALVRRYRRQPPPVTLPTIPPPPTDTDSYRVTPLLPLRDPAAPVLDAALQSHSLPRLRKPRQSAEEKAAEKARENFRFMEEFLKTLPFGSLGDFLATLFHNRAALRHSLSTEQATHPDRDNRIPEGSPWIPPLATSATASATSESEAAQLDIDTQADIPDLVDITDTPIGPPAQAPKAKANADAPKVHEEASDFTGDRVLRNSQIFMQEFGWWIEFAHSVPEGDIGRVWEIMKAIFLFIWIFKFAGSSHQNYMAYLLEVYCFLRYEASKDLHDAVLNNWLVNVRGELGKWLPGDLHQEHYNRWLEDMVQKHGGEFDDPFFRQTISPNTHTSSDLRAELILLLTVFMEEEVHLFRSERSLGHAAVAQFARGCRRFDEDGKLETFLQRSTCVADFLAELRQGSAQEPSPDDENSTTHPETPPGNESSPSASELSPSNDDFMMRPETPTRSESPSGSESSSDSSTSASSNSSTSSRSSLADIVSWVDPNEPDDDGEELSDARLTSGSFDSPHVDDETGRIAQQEELLEGDEEEEEEVEEEEEENPDLEEPSSGSDSENDGSDSGSD
ncbi:hypothetical protein C8J57DRAFT_1666793 [Mycena rebaudengoi]|nr:hypothetical protein C8J57DRAFT_1666793 [Mycena rebaudengoi]